MSADRKDLDQIQGDIMVVDDDPDHLQMWAMYIESLGYSTRSYNNPRRAVEDFIKTPRSVWGVITDGQMPGMDGRAFAEALRQIDPCLPIILHSEKDKQAIERTFGADIGSCVTDYVQKIPEFEAVECIVRTLLKARVECERNHSPKQQ